MGRALVVLFASGCLVKPGRPRLSGDAPAGSDAPAGVDAAYVVPHCSGVAFDPPLHDFYTPAASAASPVVTADGRELWFVASGVAGNLELRVASGAGGDFFTSERQVLFDVCTSASCFDPSLSQDGQLLFFLVSANNQACGASNAAAYFAVRGSDGKFPTTAQPVSASIALTGIEALVVGVGGNALYYTNQGDGNLYQVTRPERSSAFATYTNVMTGGGLPELGISPDSLELFYPHNSQIDYATRGDRNSMFAMSGTAIAAGPCERPSVSADATRLYLVDPITGNLAYLSRTCP